MLIIGRVVDKVWHVSIREWNNGSEADATPPLSRYFGYLNINVYAVSLAIACSLPSPLSNIDIPK